VRRDQRGIVRAVSAVFDGGVDFPLPEEVDS
jgi:hypothetical protein